MQKVIRPGRVKVYNSWGDGRDYRNVFIKIKFEGGCLSLSGVVGPRKSGNCAGSCGQIRDTLKDKTLKLAEAWTFRAIETLCLFWERWHLNDMRPGCEHQRELGWHTRPIDPEKPLNAYGKHSPWQSRPSWNMLTWVYPDEHPGGLLTKPCPVCGYRYGTAWKREEVPQNVIDWLFSLPETDVVPAWV